MRAGRARGYVRLPQLFVVVAGLAGCAADASSASLGNSEGHLDSPCMFDPKAGTMTISVAAGDQLVLTRRKDGALLANGETCGRASYSTAKTITITENAAAPGDEDVTLDFSGGLFGTGAAAGPGIRINLGSGDDAIAIRMTAAADKVAFGAAGITTNADTYVDLIATSASSISYSVSLGAGSDTFTGQGISAKDTPFLGNLVVSGGDGNDKLIGGDGDDQLFGGAGNDSLKGGLGDDLCAGDAGDDVFDESRPASGSNGDDVYQDSAGSKDTVDYSTRKTPLAVDIEVAASGSNDDGELELGEADQLDTGIDILLGGSASDTLGGDDFANTISGGAGDDVIAGGGGKDILNGDAGNDRFDEGDGANGADVFKGGAGIDTVDYGQRTTALLITMDGHPTSGERASNEGDNIPVDVENCIGGSGNDDMTGSTLNNVLAGGGGADTLRGGAGNDRFDEGDASNGGDTFVGGSGIDTVDYSARSQSVSVTMDGVAADDGESGEHDAVKTDIEVCLGGSGPDTLVGSSHADEIHGGDGDDILHGGAGNDDLSGEGGDDTLYGDDGDDTLDGGDDFSGDTLDCGSGDDIAENGESTTQCEIG